MGLGKDQLSEVRRNPRGEREAGKPLAGKEGFGQPRGEMCRDATVSEDPSSNPIMRKVERVTRCALWC